MQFIQSFFMAHPIPCWIFMVALVAIMVKTREQKKYWPLFAWWFILSLVNIVVTIISMFILSWFLPAFALASGHLPRWLSYLDTPDNPLDGDLGYMNEHAPFKGIGVTGWKRYVNRCMWLFRNSAYGFGINVMGKTINEVPLIIFGNQYVSDGPDKDQGRTTGLSGSVFVVGPGCFEYYSVQQKGDTATCNRTRLGWKLLGYINKPEIFPLGTKAQFVCTVKLGSKFATGL